MFQVIYRVSYTFCGKFFVRRLPANLLSDYLDGRSSNRGPCVQCCRWKYEIRALNPTNGDTGWLPRAAYESSARWDMAPIRMRHRAASGRWPLPL